MRQESRRRRRKENKKERKKRERKKNEQMLFSVSSKTGNQILSFSTPDWATTSLEMNLNILTAVSMEVSCRVSGLAYRESFCRDGEQVSYLPYASRAITVLMLSNIVKCVYVRLLAKSHIKLLNWYLNSLGSALHCFRP